MKKIVIILSLLFILQAVEAGAFYNKNEHNFLFEKNELLNEDTEYWALLVGCNEFINRPDITLPGNDIAAEDFKKLLMVSDNWKEDHIRVLTGKNATWRNIYNGLKWLNKMDDKDDICLFYIATHGGQMKDVYPKDENDNQDEYLIAYDTDRLFFPSIGLTLHIPLRLFYMIDDDINNMLSRLDSKGVCAIFNTCYSGGFNDFNTQNKYDTNSNFINEFSDELLSEGRVIIMACEENKQSKGLLFSYYLMEGLMGFSDINNNSLCSAEEAFQYASPKTKNFLNKELRFENNPQIFDDYDGELTLTNIEFPPSYPIFNGPKYGVCNNEYTFIISSIDPENDKITYYIDWGDNINEITNLYDSKEDVQLTHSWNYEGTYNIIFENWDEMGNNLYEPTFKQRETISISNEDEIDQIQSEIYDGQMFNDGFFTNNIWFAQSFITSKSILTKVDLEVIKKLAASKTTTPIHISIKKELTGDDLTTISEYPNCQFQEPELPILKWTTFDFPDIEVIPGEQYYIVCRLTDDTLGAWTFAGLGYNEDPNYDGDPYPNGMAFCSRNNGVTWENYDIIHDFCFITYGR